MPIDQEAASAPTCPDIVGGREERLPISVLHDLRQARRRAWWKWVLVVMVMWGGFALRLPNIDFGLPFTYHIDEIDKVIDIKRVLEGHRRPRKFYHPTFLVYSVAGAVEGYDLLTPGKLSERIAQGEDWEIYLVGRMWVALLGGCTILAVTLVGWRYFSFGTGLVAGLILAVAPLHILTSHYIKEDVPMVFWMTVALYFTFALMEALKGVQASPASPRCGARVKHYALAGLFAGFAASTKYIAVTFLLLILFAELLVLGKRALERQFLIRKGALIACALAGFLLFTPYAVIGMKRFTFGFKAEYRHALQGHEYQAISPWQNWWTFHLRKSVIPGMTPALTLLCGAAVVYALLKRDKKTAVLLFGAALIYFPAEASPLKPPPNFERYMVPLLVFLALLSGNFVSHVWSLPRSVALRAAVILALACVFYFPLQRDRLFIKSLTTDTRDTARQWILKNITPWANILCMDRAPYLPDLRELPFHATYWSKDLYPYYERVREYDYVIVSSLIYDRYFTIYPTTTAGKRFYARLFTETQLVKEFRPPYFTYGFHNPTIRIYRPAP
jgi:hypothetical protein